MQGRLNDVVRDQMFLAPCRAPAAGCRAGLEPRFRPALDLAHAIKIRRAIQVGAAQTNKTFDANSERRPLRHQGFPDSLWQLRRRFRSFAGSRGLRWGRHRRCAGLYSAWLSVSVGRPRRLRGGVFLRLKFLRALEVGKSLGRNDMGHWRLGAVRSLEGVTSEIISERSDPRFHRFRRDLRCRRRPSSLAIQAATTRLRSRVPTACRTWSQSRRHS
mmetsp:Transcript_21772/g.60827  ORF Transcript_21772/g.60827 Transcript_21772/m.60827 type:complete len:216 (-) Transcript_21772:741-1388(-)